MKKIKFNNQRLIRRQKRVRAKVQGTKERPLLAVYRSLNHIYAQLIDDISGRTLASVRDTEIKDKKLSKTERALATGKLLAQKAASAKVKTAVFDRREFKYHGRVKAVAEGAREGGLNI